ncbi:hypothetical protein HDK90DRAFT_462119 [Phyllosticta capitalensis]|uniref:Uncharacterized protein n=2 Tax=Phyllosticta capitalensis TaxID=121624 RepID=A0ABR1Z4L5_9PEZI
MTGGHPLHIMNIDKTPPRPSSVGGTQPETCECTSSPMEGHQGEEHVGTGDNTHNHGGIKRPASEPLTGQEVKRPSSARDKSMPGGALPKHPTVPDAPGTPAFAEHLTSMAKEKGKQENRTQGTQSPASDTRTLREFLQSRRLYMVQHYNGTKRPASNSSTGPATKRPSSAGDKSLPEDALSKHCTGSNAPMTPAFAEHLASMTKEGEDKEGEQDKSDEQRGTTKRRINEKLLMKLKEYMKLPVPSSLRNLRPVDIVLKRLAASEEPLVSAFQEWFTAMAEERKNRQGNSDEQRGTTVTLTAFEAHMLVDEVKELRAQVEYYERLMAKRGGTETR